MRYEFNTREEAVNFLEKYNFEKFTPFNKANYYIEIENNKVAKLTRILRKENLVEKYKSLNEKVVFIGDGNNDIEAMRAANISIASGLTHMPANGVLSIADYLVFNEEALCRQLNQLLYVVQDLAQGWDLQKQKL